VSFGIYVFIIVFFFIRDRSAPKKQIFAEVALIYQPAPTPGSELQALEADAEISIPANAREIYGMISSKEINPLTRNPFNPFFKSVASFLSN
jgi:hypothetical protein